MSTCRAIATSRVLRLVRNNLTREDDDRSEVTVRGGDANRSSAPADGIVDTNTDFEDIEASSQSSRGGLDLDPKLYDESVSSPGTAPKASISHNSNENVEPL
jgi:hypothetical protein